MQISNNCLHTLTKQTCLQIGISRLGLNDRNNGRNAADRHPTRENVQQLEIYHKGLCCDSTLLCSVRVSAHLHQNIHHEEQEAGTDWCYDYRD